MANNREGGGKTRDKLLARDPDYYKKIGAIGGKNGHTGGEAANPELAKIAGAKGGKKSSRKGVKNSKKGKAK